MKRKPWAIIVLAVFHILAPVGNLILNSHRMNRSLLQTWSYWAHGLPKSLFVAYVILPPLAGIFIYLCRRWSYWAYILCLSWIFAANAYSLWTNASMLNLIIFCVVILLDLLAVAYFVVPSVRTVYFDPRLRWWETAPRYPLTLEAKIDEHVGLIKNISIGGIFLEAWPGITQNKTVNLEWSYEGRNYKTPARIVYKSDKGYGIQFQHSPQTHKMMKEFINLLIKQGILPTDSRAAGPDDGFLTWLWRLFTKGEGLFPRR
jgi:hypothetical protein